MARAWPFLAALGLLINGAALLLADRLGTSLSKPVEDLAVAAGRLGAGDLDTRVEVSEIEELAVVADAFNRLSLRLRALLVEEREATADLSHRLRTPLAALRLQAEALETEDEREAKVQLVDRLQESVDSFIRDVRRSDEPEVADVSSVVAHHPEFWSVLAAEQNRDFRCTVPDRPLVVQASHEEIGDAIDVLTGNVFAHTEPGVGFRVSVEESAGEVLVSVSDDGGGSQPGTDPLRRGESGAGSTGLALDIVRRLAERTGDSVSVGSGDTGGAQVAVRLGSVSGSWPTGRG